MKQISWHLSIKSKLYENRLLDNCLKTDIWRAVVVILGYHYDNWSMSPENSVGISFFSAVSSWNEAILT